MAKKQERPHMYAVQQIDGDGNKSYTTTYPLGKEQAQDELARQRKWAKEDNGNLKFKIVKMYLSM